MHYRLPVLIAILLLGNSCSLLNSSVEKYDEAKNARLEEQIGKSSDLQSLATICQKLGDLENFVLIGRDRNSNGNPALYYYYSSGKPFSESSRSLGLFLKNDGWHQIDNPSVNETFAFQRNNLRIIVQHGGMRTADYGITCKLSAEGER